MSSFYCPSSKGQQFTHYMTFRIFRYWEEALLCWEEQLRLTPHPLLLLSSRQQGSLSLSRVLRYTFAVRRDCWQLLVLS